MMLFDIQRFALISNTTSNSIVSGTSSGDSISNSGSGAVIRAGAGNDTVDNRGPFAWLYGEDGNDSINSGLGQNSGSEANWYSRCATIIGGVGNDTFTGSKDHADVFLYASGDGNDVITNYESLDWIRITDGTSYSTQVADADILVNVGSGSIRLQNSYGKTLNIFSGNYIANETANSVVSGTGSRDFIYNGGQDAKIYAGFGDDVVDNRGAFSWLYGGDGNDSINSGLGRSSGSEANWYSRCATIIGGVGNDTFTGSKDHADVFLYASGDGNDVITNYESLDWIRITDGTSYSTQVSGADIFVNVGSGSMRLQNSYGKTLNIFSGNYIANETSNSVVSGTSSRDFIHNGGQGAKIYAGAGNDVIDNRGAFAWLYGGDGNDSINSGLGRSSGSEANWYSRCATITGGAGNDTLTGSKDHADVFQYAAGDGNDIITNYETVDSIVLTDDSSYSTVISDADILVNVRGGSMRLKNAVGKTLNIVTAGGYDTAPATVPATVPATTPADTTPTGPITITNTNKNSIVSGGAYNDTIQNYAGGVTVRGGAGNDFLFNSTNANYIVNGGHGYVTIDAGDGNDTIKSINPHMSLVGGNGNDSIYSAAAAYITINGNKGNDTILGGGAFKVIEYANGDGNDVFTGISATDTIRITDGSSYSTVKSGSDVIMSIGSGSMTLKNAVDKTFKVVGGTDITSVVTVPADTVPSGSSDSSGTTLTMTLSLGSTGFTYSIDGDKVTLKDNGGQFSLTINGVSDFSGASKVFDLHDIDGIWNSASTITGGRGNDKLYGTDGADTFIYSSGNDKIYNYGAEDRIVLDAEITKVKISGKNVKLTTSEGNLTIKKAVGQELTIIDADGVESTYKFTKQNKDLDSARITTVEQLPSEDYWFEQSSEESPLSEIVSTEASLDISTDILTPKNIFEPTERIVSARSRRQK